MSFLPLKIVFKKIAKKYRIKLILLFGSQVNKKTHKMSDIDIGILLEKNNLGFQRFSRLLNAFQKLFPDKKIDLAIMNNADPLFLKKILENYKVLFGNKKQLSQLQLYSFHQFCDYKKYFDLEQEFNKNFIKTFK